MNCSTDKILTKRKCDLEDTLGKFDEFYGTQFSNCWSLLRAESFARSTTPYDKPPCYVLKKNGLKEVAWKRERIPLVDHVSPNQNRYSKTKSKKCMNNLDENESLRKELEIIKEKNLQLIRELSVKNNLIEKVQIALDKVKEVAIREDIDRKRLQQSIISLECQIEELTNDLLRKSNEKNRYIDNNVILLEENETLKLSCSVMESKVEKLNNDLQNLQDIHKFEKQLVTETYEDSPPSESDSYLHSLEDEIMIRSEKLLKADDNLRKEERRSNELRLQNEILLSEDKLNESFIKKYKEEQLNYSLNHKYDNNRVEVMEEKMKKLEQEIEDNSMLLDWKDSEISKLKMTIKSTSSENDKWKDMISELNLQVSQLKMALEVFQFILTSPSEFLKPSAIEIITLEIQSMNFNIKN